MSCPFCQKEHPYTTSEALSMLAAAPRRLEKLAAAIGPNRATRKPAPDKWSAKEIICHLADCELTYGFRYRKIISEPNPVLVPFDQEAWAKNLQYQSQQLKPALATFAALRAGHVSLLRSLPPESWEKAGQHPEYGALTLGQIVIHLVQHDLNHIAQVERLCPPPAKKAKPKTKGRRTR